MPTDIRAVMAQMTTDPKAAKKAAKSDATPKFFNATLLTGMGAARKTGLLSASADPAAAPEPPDTPEETVNGSHAHYTSGQTETWRIPVSPLTAAIWTADVQTMSPLAPHDWVRLGPITATQHTHTLATGSAYLAIEPHAILVSKTKTPGATHSNTRTDLVVTYHIMTAVVWDHAQDKPLVRASDQDMRHIFDNPMGTLIELRQKVTEAIHDNRAPKNVFWGTWWTARPASALKGIARGQAAYAAMGRFTNGPCPPIDVEIGWDQDTVDAWLGSYSLYGHLCRRAEFWTQRLEDALEAPLANLAESHLPQGSRDRVDALKRLAVAMTAWEAYPVGLERYRAIYDRLEAALPDRELSLMAKQNMNLLLADEMAKLDALKPQLPRTPKGRAAATGKANAQQRAAIETDEPLVITQAGAGTGKSTTLKNRIRYMIDAGIDPTDIMVLSFTNAAADHVKEIAPHVHSMTIASMVNEIYCANYPTHRLAQTGTLVNMLECSYRHAWDTTLAEFVRRLKAIDAGDKGAMTRLNGFVEAHFDQVLSYMDAVALTTLELEIIICYIQLEKLTEPADVKASHLLVDEVQDNSIFEFIYILRHVAKTHQSLYITGDSSQTLFEFRDANAKALNVLEMSGVFAAYKLETNYRSNQEILDFANTQLAKIEANRFADIRLHSNDRRIADPVSADSLAEKVHIHHERLPRMRDLSAAIKETMRDVVTPWATERLKEGRTVACLAYSRAHVHVMEEELRKLFPGRRIDNIVPERAYDQTVLSNYISRYWEAAAFIPSASLVAAIQADIMANLTSLTRYPDKARPHVQSLLWQWGQENRIRIAGWVQQATSGVISRQTCLDYVRNTLVDAENSVNSAKASLMSQRNAMRKEQTQAGHPDFVVSTIHSAKGLEFDSTVVVYNYGSDQLSEDMKRLYYVALTRAMDSELVLAFGTHANPRICRDYDELVESLARQDTTRRLFGSAPTTP